MSGQDKDDDGFMQRWSRRKRLAVESGDARGFEETAPSLDSTDVDAVTADEHSESDEAAENPEIAANRAAAEAVDLEALTYESDFTVFMKKGVPEALKNAALRKLWRSNPMLAVVDGLNDYDLNYRTADTVLTNFQSAWKVGQGYSDKAEEVRAEMEARSAELAAEREAKAAEAAERDEEKPEEPQEAENVETAETDGDELKGLEVAVPEQPVDTEPEVQKVSIRRRMAFDTDS